MKFKMFIKVCGITDKKQAEQIEDYGATHIGVIHFEKSPRHININKIKDIKENLQKSKLVAVVVNPTEDLVKKLLDITDIIQFHGDESLEFIKKFPKERVIKAFRIKDENSIEKIKLFVNENYLILIDAYSEKEYGGTGKQINQKLVLKVKNLTDRFILSGGLDEKNVYELIKKYKPFGVDASSKLELKPGIKDLNKVKNYIINAKKAFGEISE